MKRPQKSWKERQTLESIHGNSERYFDGRRLSIDLFEWPKIRDTHINKSSFLVYFFFIWIRCIYGAFSMSRYSYRFSVGHFNDPRYRWPDINWSDELIFFFVHMPRIFITCKVHIILKKAIIMRCSRDCKKKKQRYNEQKARGKKVV